MSEVSLKENIVYNVIMGIVYLIQPAELVGTNRVKIGCSKKNDLSRILSYKKGTNFVCICSTEKPLLIEKVIIAVFTTHFEKIAGNEYFMGDLIEMRKMFLQQVQADTSFTSPLSQIEKVIVSDDVPSHCIRGDIQAFVNKYVERDRESAVTLKELKKLYQHSEYYNGKILSLRGDLEQALNVPYVEEKRFNGVKIRGVFEGYRIVT